MNQNRTTRAHLASLTREWEEAARLDTDHYPYCGVLDEILFHADLRFSDYIQYREEGEFPVRLRNWLGNVPRKREKQILFQLLPFLLFVDRWQLQSLHRDAYRRIIVPWVCNGQLTSDDILSSEYEILVRSRLKRYLLLSITESFSFPDFLHVNNLSGLPKPRILGEDKIQVKGLVQVPAGAAEGLIIFEDFVGTGKQARGVLREIRRYAASDKRILFVPLIMLESGLKRLLPVGERTNIEINPVMVITNKACLQKDPFLGELDEFKYLRALVKVTAGRVLRSLGPLDDPPVNAFGYGDSGALLVTCHNAPNNTLPLIHHRAPNWNPLFRRVHHSKDGLR
ncbi:hypothetical protein HY626_01175 [Candidatus Uhrbacteria bacterium]|nr:hypothetical protein [Candidatus Uhrbacteria bacterium]